MKWAPQHSSPAVLQGESYKCHLFQGFEYTRHKDAFVISWLLTVNELGVEIRRVDRRNIWAHLILTDDDDDKGESLAPKSTAKWTISLCHCFALQFTPWSHDDQHHFKMLFLLSFWTPATLRKEATELIHCSQLLGIVVSTVTDLRNLVQVRYFTKLSTSLGSLIVILPTFTHMNTATNRKESEKTLRTLIESWEWKIFGSVSRQDFWEVKKCSPRPPKKTL